MRTTATSRRLPVAGFLLAVASAASFALSGIFASALMEAGWSPGATTTARLVLAALVLLVPTLVSLRGRWILVLRGWRPVLLFGLLAVAGCQLAFFISVRFIPPSLALLIEFMGPVLLVFWMWARTRVAPSPLTLLGAALAVGGLAAISGIGAGAALHPLGILFGLVAAIGNAVYYAAGSSSSHGIPPLPFVGLGLGVAAIVMSAVSLTGLLPFTATAEPVVIAGTSLSPALAIAGMVLISTVTSYVLGVAASRRLGATLASFTGYSESLFGIFWTIVLLAILPTGLQWLGAALIIAGVVTVRIGELVGSRRARATREPAPQEPS
ncbi:EamA family transporter [Leucobacter ruminantium]|uniref:DMT family transporter n=1 Tax=Leucobacter ruminantium TaxID=1289170 RepID=A0A939RZ18_9MICO|nr:DMT family transporter [Leucobacter ruminantium]